MNPDVNAFLNGLEHARKQEIVSLTTEISKANPGLQSEIKWSAPSFTINGTNVLTFRLFPDPAFQVILHIGAKKLANPPDMRFEITQFTHKWADSTRCVITIEEDLNFQALNKVLKKWLRRVSEIG